MPRKVQFSQKQKKQQLQEKRKRKQERPYRFGNFEDEEKSVVGIHGQEQTKKKEGEAEVEEKPVTAVGTAYERYALVFGAESKEELEAGKKWSREPLGAPDERLLSSSVEQYTISDPTLGMPRRGRWNYSMSKEKLEKQEEAQFKEWTKKLDEHYTELGRASYYERNLETWRQLWRTLEMSDVILFVCDVRYPTLHFSHPVYKYITEELEKQVILVLNKIDMVNPAVSVSWKRYFETSYPGLRVVLFSSRPDNQRTVENSSKRLLKREVIRKQGWAYGADSLVRLAKCWYEDKRVKELDTPMTAGGGDPVPLVAAAHGVGGGDTGASSAKSEDEGKYVTIGMIGQPNAGKSSLINGLLQDKRVSVSRTPGHTKHFQTIFYSEDVRLCDCPGLVFPTTAPKQLQVISGMFPVAQVREPYSIVRYIAERLDLPSLLRVELPEDVEGGWTAWYLCYTWAEKLGFAIARTGGPDVYRGANSILKIVVEGRLCVRLTPPDYTDTPIVGSYLDLLSELMYFAGDKKEQDEEEEEEDESEESEEEDSNESEGGTGTENAFSLLGKLDD